LKGGNSRWQRKRKQQRKNQRRKRGIKARRLITIPKAFGITIPNFNPGGEFIFLPVFFCRGVISRLDAPGLKPGANKRNTNDDIDIVSASGFPLCTLRPLCEVV
jgi:hypothetical protein